MKRSPIILQVHPIQGEPGLLAVVDGLIDQYFLTGQEMRLKQNGHIEINAISSLNEYDDVVEAATMFYHTALDRNGQDVDLLELGGEDRTDD